MWVNFQSRTPIIKTFFWSPPDFCSQDARANEVDSGTELEEDEIEEIGSVEEEKGEEEKKEDWEEEWRKETKSPQPCHQTVNVSYSWSESLNLDWQSKSNFNEVKIIHQSWSIMTKICRILTTLIAI